MSYIEIIVCIFIFKFFIKTINCQTENIIFGSTDAEPGEFPGLVSIQDIVKGHMCGGTIIKENLILTAAHCFTKSNTAPYPLIAKRTEIFSCDLSNDYASLDRQYGEVESICTHHKYDKYSMRYDIAIIRLKNPFNFTKTCHAVELANQSSSIGTECTVAGWGHTIENTKTSLPTKLQRADIEIVKRRYCRQFSNANFGRIFQRKTMICAGNPGVADSCTGDSGGPLICNDKLEGIISVGIRPCGGNYAIYTRIPYFFRRWIQVYMNTGVCPSGVSNNKGDIFKTIYSFVKYFGVISFLFQLILIHY